MIRLYGHQIGEGSFTQVTRGIERALKHHEVFAGFVPIDKSLGEYSDYPGAEAPISVNVGAPFVLHSVLMGLHKKRWLMLAPNSETLAPSFTRRITDNLKDIGRVYHGLLTPSRWGASVLRKHFDDLPVVIAPHGITPEIHQPLRDLREFVRESYSRGEFRVLHMTSGRTRRKGTRELIRAWKLAKQDKLIPERAVLSLVIEPHFTEVIAWAREVDLAVDTDGTDANADIMVRHGFGLPPDGVVQLYSYAHLVAQPSRGEGFGCIPLEARACGVPVLMTNCTGHTEHARQSHGPLNPPDEMPHGYVFVKTGENAPQDDFDNSMGPSLHENDVLEALALAYKNWPIFDRQAFEISATIREHWPWEKVVEPAMKELLKGT